jgi:hypothetical protein
VHDIVQNTKNRTRFDAFPRATDSTARPAPHIVQSPAVRAGVAAKQPQRAVGARHHRGAGARARLRTIERARLGLVEQLPPRRRATVRRVRRVGKVQRPQVVHQAVGRVLAAKHKHRVADRRRARRVIGARARPGAGVGGVEQRGVAIHLGN